MAAVDGCFWGAASRMFAGIQCTRVLSKKKSTRKVPEIVTAHEQRRGSKLLNQLMFSPLQNYCLSLSKLHPGEDSFKTQSHICSRGL